MKIRGSHMVVKALEDEGVRFTFGIPGTHNTELYDALADSEQITPVLVTDERGGAFMADAVSRTSQSIGVLNVVPGAGVTHCLSGVAEALLDNVPMLVLACGIRGDTGAAFQLHDVDQLAVLRPLVKEAFKVESPDDLYPAVRKAIAIARSGTPGPVAVEVPAEFYILHHEIQQPKPVAFEIRRPAPSPDSVLEAVKMLNEAKHPALYVGNGARGAGQYVQHAAEKLSAPVTTTIQGKGVLDENHPLWLWNGFGEMAPPFVRKIMDRCDCLLAVGCRFGEVATASYGLRPPENLIHVDIDKEVFDKNYPAKTTVQADAMDFLYALLPLLKDKGIDEALVREIAEGHNKIDKERDKRSGGKKVSPALFFKALQQNAAPDAVYATDSGNGTFLAMEHLRLPSTGLFIAPVDFSCMGYSVPAAVGAKLVDPNRDVIALAGDGALLMTGLELLTAVKYRAAPIVFLLRDKELGQIAQFQKLPLNRDTCTVLAPFEAEHFARLCGCEYLKLERDADLKTIMPQAFETARAGKPVFVETNIDYSEKTYFTKGVLTANFWRLPMSERLRMICRVVKRRIKN